MAQLDVHPTGDQEVAGWTPPVLQHSFVEIGHEIFSTVILSLTNRHSGSVVERPLCDREVAGSIPGRVIPKTLKMVLAALSLGAQH